MTRSEERVMLFVINAFTCSAETEKNKMRFHNGFLVDASCFVIQIPAIWL